MRLLAFFARPPPISDHSRILLDSSFKFCVTKLLKMIGLFTVSS